MPSEVNGQIPWLTTPSSHNHFVSYYLFIVLSVLSVHLLFYIFLIYMEIFRNKTFAYIKSQPYRGHPLSCWMRSICRFSRAHQLTLYLQSYPHITCVEEPMWHCCIGTTVFNTSCSNTKPDLQAQWRAEQLPHNSCFRDGKTFHCWVPNLHYNLSIKQNKVPAVLISPGGLICDICLCTLLNNSVPDFCVVVLRAKYVTFISFVEQFLNSNYFVFQR